MQDPKKVEQKDAWTSQMCACDWGREDWRVRLWPQCVGCSKNIYDNITLFLSGARRDTFPYKHQHAQTRAIASPQWVSSKESPPSLTAEAVLLQQRGYCLEKSHAHASMYYTCWLKDIHLVVARTVPNRHTRLQDSRIYLEIVLQRSLQPISN